MKYKLLIVSLFLSIFCFNLEVNAADNTYTFSYTGNYQEFVAPSTGEYLLEVWGARGGGHHQDSEMGHAGLGGYSKGTIRLKKGDKLYIYVGEEGSWTGNKIGISKESWNGGGTAQKLSSGGANPTGAGGGATDIRLVPGEWKNEKSLLSRIIVAGGGGGGSMDGEHGGDGGGLSGYTYDSSFGASGTQTTGWAFGYGFSANEENKEWTSQSWGQAGGGGGWYGGMPSTLYKTDSGGGGSGFIWNIASQINVPEGYSVPEKYYLKDAETIAGNQKMPTHDGTGTMTGNNTNGYAKITLTKKYGIDLNTEFPIKIKDLEIKESYKDGERNYEVTLPSSVFHTTITYDENTYIWSYNTGDVTLENQKVHQVVLMDYDGYIHIYNIYPNMGKAKINKLEYDEGAFEFQSDVYGYSFNVSSKISEFDPIIEVDQGLTVEISKKGLKTGTNKITILVSGNNLESTTYEFNIYKELAITVSSAPIIENFEYNDGNYEIFTAPYTTSYTLEVWGARGGGHHQDSEMGYPGLGGYSKGTVTLKAGEKLYIYVGEEGSWTGNKIGVSKESWNGGGSAQKLSSGGNNPTGAGGGATDIRIVPGEWKNEESLLSRIIVAGGGGGGSMDGERGGDGGGLSGYSYSTSWGASGTQTTGWAFGYGFSANEETKEYTSQSWGQAGAGGGWYGGMPSKTTVSSGGGGSGFIWTKESAPNVPSGYIPSSRYYLIDAETIAGNQKMPTYDGTSTMTGNNASGHAKITYYNPEGLDELLSITTDKGELTPEFDLGIFEYYVSLNTEDTSITIDATTKLNEALLMGTGTYEVPAGETDFPITMTNLNGTVSVYILKVSRPANASAILNGFKVNGLLYEGFQRDKFNYEIELPTEIEKINLELIKEYPGQVIPEDKIYDFTENEKEINIIVSSESNLANQVYNFKFTRKKSTKLKKLEITGGSLKTKFNPNVTEYTLEMANYVRELPMIATPYFEEANIVINENRYIPKDATKVVITVTMEGVETTTYTLNIERVEPLLNPVNESFSYTGDYQTFTAPSSALYTLEVWGARGGGHHQDSEMGYAGLGGYSRGSVYLNAGEKLYVYVGEEGSWTGNKTGVSKESWNGGGSGMKTSSGGRNPTGAGGGATDIRLVPGEWKNEPSLLSRIIVAGGGGGGSMDGEHGGDGGGLSGYSYSTSWGAGGTQTTGWAFGYGFSANNTTLNLINKSYGAAGGGGGWYGGANPIGERHASGGGGSGFVLTQSSAKNVPKGYLVDERYYLKDTETIAGNQKMPTFDGKKLMTGNNTNGYAKITATPEVVGDAFLDSITVDNNPSLIEFYPWELTYELELPKEYGEVLIEAVPKNSEATIIGTGMIKLKPGLNDYKIVVSTDEGTNKVYTLKINKEASDDSTPTNILLKNPQSYLCASGDGYCQYTFAPETTLYEINLPFATEKISLEAILKSNYQKVEYRDVTDGTSTVVTDPTFELKEGTINTFEVEITSESGKETTTYTYKIVRDDTGNNNLKSLEIKDPVTDINFEPLVYEYYLTVPAETEKLDLEAIPQNPLAKVKVLYNENFQTGLNAVHVLVTAPNGNSKTYLLHVYKEQSSNTFLQSLSVKDENNQEVELSPTFNKMLTDYTGNVDSNTKSVTIEATAEEGTVTGTGTFNLVSGNNTFEITVTSQTGDTQIYKVNIVKAKNNNSNLLNIEVDGYELSPAFTKENKNYLIVIPQSVTKVGVKVTPEESTTTYTIKGHNNLNNASNTIVITSIAEDKSYSVYEITVKKEASENNFLDRIELSTGSFNETFDKETNNYTMNVGKDVSGITITGVPEDKAAAVSGNGTYSLGKGDNTITLDVTSEAGETNTYTITITREMDDDVTLKEVKNNRGSIVTKAEDPSVGYDYLINVQYETPDVILEGIANSSSSRVTGNGYYSLGIGNNDITLRVTSEAGNYKDYVVRVVRDLSTNDDLSFLFVEEGGLNPHFNETTIFYNVKVPNNVTEVHIEAIPEDKDATVDIVGDTTNLEVGVPREIQVVVTAPKGNQKTYTLSITRQEATVENLALLKLETNRGELTPVFNPDTLNYTLEVENEITDITVTAESLSDTVQVLGTGKYDLRVGKNGISVFVVGTDEVQRDYQIVVTRKKSKDATLSSLVVKSHTLSPTFNKTTENYTLTTSGTYLDFTTIKPTEIEATYIVSGNENFQTGENTVTIEVTAPDGETKKTYTLTVTKTGSKNNNLSSLAVEGYQIIPRFHKATTFYSLEVPNDLNSIVITGAAEDPNATITGTGLKKVETGENYFEVVVTSEAGTEKKYTILVNKEASDNNYLGSLFLSDGELQPEFDKETTSYGVTVPYTVTEITLTGSPEDSHATATGLTTYQLQDGENNIVITVTSESGLVKTYTVKVTKEETISAYLVDLEAKGYELDTEFNKELFEYYITVGNEVTELDLSYTPEDKNATVNVTGNENFEIGMNEVHIEVTSSDGNLTEEYILYVNREFSTNNYLSSLSVDKGTLNPNFDPSTLTYNVEVDREVEKIIVSATTEDKSATIISGTGEHTLNLGNNLIQVKVRSSIGITRTYKINVLRKQDNDNYLSILVVSNKGEALALTPNFNKLTNEYTVSAGNDLNFIQIRAEAESEYATVVGSGTKEVKTGANQYEITVTAEDGSTNTYVLNLTKEVSDNNYLSSLIPSVGTLDPEFNKETLEYTLKLGAEDTSLGFTVTPESNLSTVTGAETQTVSDGESVRLITVTAENGDVKTYKVKVQKETESEPRLEKLEILGYPFEFDPDTFEYHVQVSKSKKQLLESEITAVPKDSNATVNLMGDLNLIDGVTNTYIVEVIAKDGYTTQEYKIHITRDSLEYTIRSNVYDINRDGEVEHVIGMDPKTKKVDFLPNFENDPETLHIYGSDGVEITEEEKFIGSYMTIKLEIDGYTYDELVITVRGDLNGDGLVTAADNVQAKAYVLGKKQRTFLVTKIADINKDGLLTAPDVVRIKNYILGKRGLNE